jgi:SAM-dependent methyltransferase
MTPLGRLANAAFELLYGPAVPLYDWVSRTGFAGEWARWQRVVLRYVHSGPVLEIGPGTGNLLPALAAQGLQPCGAEPSPQMIARARRKLNQSGQAPPLVRGRADTLPFAAGVFGAVVATFPSAWVFQTATWDEIARVLRPGGEVAIVLSGELAPHGIGRALRARAYRLLYQPLTPNRLPPPPAASFPLQWEIVPTRHGRALVLAGQKSYE